MTRITILYSELADYSLACFKELSHNEVSVQLIHWPVNPEAPFKFDLSVVDQHLDRSKHSNAELSKLVKDFNPSAILCSGWMDKGYMAVCKEHVNRIPVILSLDNHWTGSIKQQIARLISPFTIRKTFNRAFVPGQVQKEYALRLGFKSNMISTGFYSADTSKFSEFYQQSIKSMSSTFPRRFLYLGRYVEHKGIFEMWEAFKKFRKVHQDWELWCVGTGDQYEQRVESEGVRHFGFVQPNALLPILKQTGVYILPSHFEPWGVSVHEMAVVGFPLLLSDAIGAKEMFLDEGVNGSVFAQNNADALLEKMEWIARMSDEELFRMGEESHIIGMRHTPEVWVERLMGLIG